MVTRVRRGLGYGIALAGLAALGTWAAATTVRADDRPTLRALAQQADVIALVQVKDTDYFTRRGIPVSGSAYLKVLIPYRMDRPQQMIEIRESGLHPGECYFPNPTVFEEGRRYLVFLRRDPEDDSRYRGLDAGCAIDVLVAADNRYAARYPVTGIDLADALGELAEKLRFSDPYAIVADADLSPADRNEWQEHGLIVPWQAPAAESGEPLTPPASTPTPRQWLYTRGIPLSRLRGVMGPLDPQPTRR